MGTLRIRDLPGSRTLDHAAMASIRGAGNSSGGWVMGWIAPFVGAVGNDLGGIGGSGGNAMGNAGTIVNVSNTFYVQVINAAQANFQNQTTDVFNTGSGAMIDVGTSQASAISRH